MGRRWTGAVGVVVSIGVVNWIDDAADRFLLLVSEPAAAAADGANTVNSAAMTRAAMPISPFRGRARTLLSIVDFTRTHRSPSNTRSPPLRFIDQSVS
jgi:hypothetical protein